MSSPKDLGQWGESEAVVYLTKKGLKLVERHFQTRWGEVASIFKDRDTWVFVEVKARSHATDYPAGEAVTKSKQRRLMNAALMYMKQHRLEDEPLRFDVILLENGGIEWIPDAFEGSSHYTY
jgi:putative endonuclease